MAPTSPPVATTAPPATALPNAAADVTTVDESGNTSIDPAALSDALGPTSSSALTSTESESLLYMREEEKLAHDVYVTLYQKWNPPVFQNIADSELTHTDAVKALLDRYQLADPAAGNDVGTFANVTLQGLYDQLVAQGSQSLAEALKVGAIIEDLDIFDLQQRIAQTDRADIILLYENLMKGSRNHLRSFVSTMQTQVGQAYSPQYITQAEYDAVVGTPIESGGRGPAPSRIK